MARRWHYLKQIPLTPNVLVCNLTQKNKAINLPLCPRSVLPPPAFLHESIGHTPCLHHRRTRCRRSHLLSIVASACNVSHLCTKLGSACIHGSCVARRSRPRQRPTAPSVQCSSGGASPNKKSCSSNDPTCTSGTPSLVKFLYEVIQICAENFGRVSFFYANQTKI